MHPRLPRLLSLLFILVVAVPARAAEPAQTVLHLLDYIAVDYAEAVENGKVKNPDTSASRPTPRTPIRATTASSSTT
jgi:hypothetical protein